MLTSWAIGKGIGPCYSSKASRSGVRIADIFNEELFEDKVRKLAAGLKKRFGDLLQYDPEEEIRRFRDYRAELAPLVVDQLPLLVSSQASEKKMLIEGKFRLIRAFLLFISSVLISQHPWNILLGTLYINEAC